MPARGKQPRSGAGAPAHTIDPNAAGVDIGATEIYIAVPTDRDPIRCAKFSTFTEDLAGRCGLAQAVRNQRQWPWSRPESTGYRYFRSWRQVG